MYSPARNPIKLVARILAALSLLAAPWMMAQEAPGPPPASAAQKQQDSSNQVLFSSLATIRVRSSLVVAPFSVMNPSGDFVEDLTQKDFRVLDDGVPQQITRFGLAMQPVAAVIVIQTNQYVAPLLGHVTRLGPLFSNLLLGTSGKAAVITFNDVVQVVQNFSNDPDSLARTLNNIRPEGGKARLSDALARAVLMLANQTEAHRRVIIVFSDGFDHGSITGRGQIVQAATDAGVAIYGLRFDPTQASVKHGEEAGEDDSDSGPNFMPLVDMAFGIGSARVRRNLMQWYAGYTGGVVYKHWKNQRLENQLQKIALEINSQYVLAYVPSTLDQTGFHRIRIVVSQPRLRVRTRAGYFYGLRTK